MGIFCVHRWKIEGVVEKMPKNVGGDPSCKRREVEASAHAHRSGSRKVMSRIY